MHKLHLRHIAAVLALCLPLLAFGAERQVVDIAVKGMTCPFCAYDKRLGTPRHEADPAQVARVVDLLGEWRRTSGRPVLGCSITTTSCP